MNQNVFRARSLVYTEYRIEEKKSRFLLPRPEMDQGGRCASRK